MKEFDRFVLCLLTITFLLITGKALTIMLIMAIRWLTLPCILLVIIYLIRAKEGQSSKQHETVTTDECSDDITR